MSSKDSIWNKVSAPAAVVVVAALFSGVFSQATFESARPRSLNLSYDPTRTPGRASGLITFDPLEQAYAEVEQLYKDKGSKEPPWLEDNGKVAAPYSFGELARGLFKGVTLGEDVGRVLVLLESVRGGALSEDHERRLRGRYATMSALAHEQLYPDDGKRLQLAWLEDPEYTAGASTSDGAPTPNAFSHPTRRGVLVPYEYVRGVPTMERPYARAVVCWVDEAAIERNPLRFGLEFERTVRRSVEVALCADALKFLDVRWLGPTTSSGLKALLSGVDDPAARSLSALKIVTPYATSPFLTLPVPPKWEERSFALSRAVNTDDVLARLLVNELVLRVPELMPMNCGPESACELHPKHASECQPACVTDAGWDKSSPSWVRVLAAPLRKLNFVPKRTTDKPVRVALITEVDSTYGQAWTRNMLQARRDWVGVPGAPGPHPQLARLEFSVFPVFAWVDGVVREASDKKDASAATSVARDYPAEAHQLDYVRRLRDELQTEGEFAAIAIFVTEEYDTMMILEALRPQFPGAMFLTTDLDARYLHSRHAPFTRNLIVASHFGLSPESELEPEPKPELEVADPSERVSDDANSSETEVLKPTPPEFRDGYQSGVWRAVCALARNQEPKPPPTASVYEIGRSRIVQLNGRARPCPAPKAPAPRVEIPLSRGAPPSVLVQAYHLFFPPCEVHAAHVEVKPLVPPKWLLWLVYVGSGCSLALLLLGLLVFGTRTGRGSTGLLRADSRTLLMFLGMLAVAALVVLLRIHAELSQSCYFAEPIELLEGVSAWPTIFLRIAMTCVAVLALIAIPLRLRGAVSSIANENGISAGGKPVSVAWALDWGYIDEGTGRRSGARWRALGLVRAVLHAVTRPIAAVFTGRSALETAVAPQRSIGDVLAFAQQALSRPWLTRARMLVFALMAYMGLAPFFIISGTPPNPVRGEFAYLLERISLFASVISFLMLILLVMETSFFATRLVAQIVNPAAVSWPASDTSLGADRRRRLELAQDIAGAVDPLVWSPMAVLGLMIVSRASVFDAWPWPTVLVVLFSAFFVMLMMCIVSMRRQCERARTDALKDLDFEERCIELDEAKSKRLAVIRKQIEALSGGAFSPLIYHPVLRALSLPLTAFGANLAFERNLLERFLSSL